MQLYPVAAAVKLGPIIKNADVENDNLCTLLQEHCHKILLYWINAQETQFSSNLICMRV
jgi:hypothetical protein